MIYNPHPKLPNICPKCGHIEVRQENATSNLIGGHICAKCGAKMAELSPKGIWRIVKNALDKKDSKNPKN